MTASPTPAVDGENQGLERALEIRDEMIQVARTLADRSCGATQSEMRQAQGEYLAGFANSHDALVAELEWLAAFAQMRSEDDSKTFARVNRAALRNIAERARAALAGAQS